MVSKEARSFTLVKAVRSNGSEVKCDNGRYKSTTPMGAAKKAFSQCSKQVKVGETAKLVLEIHIQETTQNSNKKVYKYKVTREYQPREVIRNGVAVTYKYAKKAVALK